MKQRTPNVDYRRLIDAGTKLALAVSSHSNEEQNAIYSMLVEMKNMIDDQDYRSSKYTGTMLEPLANHLVSLCRDMNLVQAQGEVKKKRINCIGGQRKHRLGSRDKSSNKLPYKCGFCGGGGAGINGYHSSVSSCPVKESLGRCIDTKKEDGMNEVRKDIKAIFSGVYSQFLNVLDVVGNFKEREMITGELPKGTKHLQIKGYTLIGSEKFLFGSCFDGYGKVLLACRVGSQMKSYQDPGCTD